MDKLKVGFIGCGRHATKTLYPSLKYVPVSLEAVCDLDKRLAERNARWFGAQQVFTDYEEMLANCALDAVIVVTGPGTHAPLAAAVIEAGLPVLIEKPPAYTLEETNQLARLSAEKGIPVTVGLMKRWAVAYQRAKSIISTAPFGPVTHVQATFRVGQKKGSGYALLLDAGIHILDLVRYLGGDVKTIHSEKWQHEAGLAYAIVVQFDSGAVGSIHISDQGSWSSQNETVEITGCGQFVRVENLLRVAHTQSDGITSLWEPGMSIPQNQNNSLFLQGYVPEIEAWVSALLAGEQPPHTIGDTCKTMELVKQLEPEEDYRKEPQAFSHWQAENQWLTLD